MSASIIRRAGALVVGLLLLLILAAAMTTREPDRAEAPAPATEVRDGGGGVPRYQ